MDIQADRSRFFCSLASQDFKELLAGTAANYKAFILVEYCGTFPEKATKAYIDDQWLEKLQHIADRRSAKVVLIRNKKTRLEISRVIYVDCVAKRYFIKKAVPSELPLVDLEKLITDPATVWRDDPFFIVCTNGKKDKCCAKFGQPVYKELYNRSTEAEVWECTHIGGDRFAANMVVLPYGIYYGRVQPRDAEKILEHTEQQAIYTNCYRGLSSLSFFEQSVEYFLREEEKDFEMDFSFSILKKINDGNTIFLKVNCKNTLYELTVLRKHISYPYLLTCKSLKSEKLIKYELLLINKIKTA